MIPEPQTIKWGIIGLGSIAHKFATDLLTVKDARLYAVASRQQQKANAFASQYNAIKAYNSYEALANDSNVDAVYIATPHAFHYENTLLCLEQGIAVLCEKPFAMHANQVAAMIRKAKAKNTLLMEALWTYFLPHYQYVLEVLNTKRYGAVLKMEADFGFYKPFDNQHRLFNKALGGGSLLDIGIYPIFAALSTLGQPKHIEAKAHYFDNGADASCDMIFEYDNAVKAYLKSALNKDTPTTATFYCEKGTITINQMFHAPATVTVTPHSGTPETIDFGYTTIGYNYEVAHFNALLKSGKTESDVMSFAFSETLIGLLDTIRAQIGLDYH
jgi:predicted dehydrogenase